MNALLVIRLLDLAILAAQNGPAIVAAYRRSRDVLEACAAEGRDPSEAELGELEASVEADRTVLFGD